jgi:hypothetical protein
MLLAGDGGWLFAIEHSGVGQAIRQSVWIYAFANVTHVVTLAVFAGAVCVMDLRLLGFLSGSNLSDIVTSARRLAVAALIVMIGSGACLFIAEASHVAQNPVFLAKMAVLLVIVGIALGQHGALMRFLRNANTIEAIPFRLRATAAMSLGAWLVVAALGRTIAYV